MSKRCNTKRNAKRNRIKRGLVAAAAAASTMLCVAPLAQADDYVGTTIFVDGTQKILPFGSAEGAADVAGGIYREVPGFQQWWVDYDQSFWPFTGLFDPTYNKSVEGGAENTVAAIKEAQAENSGQPIIAVCLSQGAHVCSLAAAQLEREGFNTPSMYYVYAASPVNNDGGILTRSRLLGALFNADGTAPSQTANAAQIVREYDGWADFPVYPLNLLATANAVMGMVFLHNYSDIDLQDPDNVITTTPDGRLTNVLIPTERLPLLVPIRIVLEAFGLPTGLVDVADAFLRPLVDLGYDRPDPDLPGSYPTEPVRFKFSPTLGEIAEALQESWQDGLQSLHDLATPGDKAPIAPEPDLVAVNAAAAVGDEPEVELQPAEPVQPQGSPDGQQEPVSEEPVQPEPSQAPVNQGGDAQESQVQDDGQQEPTQSEKPGQHAFRHSFRATPEASKVDEARNSETEVDTDSDANGDADKKPGAVQHALSNQGSESGSEESSESSSQSSGSGSEAGGES